MKALSDIYSIFLFITEDILGRSVVIFLLAFGVYAEIKLKFFNIAKAGTVIRSLTGKEVGYKRVESIRALTVALAGTLGVGNITGVASAIVCGGPGAIFWMWVAATLSMLIKYCEIVLAVKNRVIINGETCGGAMYYMKKKIALSFSVLCILASFAIGNFLQVNAIVESINYISDINPAVIGVILSVTIWLAISRGTRGISSFTLFLVPIMSLIYAVLSLTVVLKNCGSIISVFSLIVRSAFCPSSVLGGVGGYGIMQSIKYGINRGIISNEAGCGTAPMAYASDKNKSPVEQGFWGIFEVFADTIVMCTLTAFVILLSYNETKGLLGMELVIRSFERSVGSCAALLICTCVLLFGVATIVGWSYYGINSTKYLLKDRYTERGVRTYTVIFSLSCTIGSILSADSIWTLSDFCIGGMTVLNLCSMLKHIGEIKSETDQYFLSGIRSHASKK